MTITVARRLCLHPISTAAGQILYASGPGSSSICVKWTVVADLEPVEVQSGSFMSEDEAVILVGRY